MKLYNLSIRCHSVVMLMPQIKMSIVEAMVTAVLLVAATVAVLQSAINMHKEPPTALSCEQERNQELILELQGNKQMLRKWFLKLSFEIKKMRLDASAEEAKTTCHLNPTAH